MGGTLAYVFMNTDPVENVFQPSVVTTAVIENGGAPVVGSNENTGKTKTNVQIKNTGDTDAYIRVAVVVNWADATGTRVWAQKPVLGTDYTITYDLNNYDLNNSWSLGSDGYYYYSGKVAPNGVTPVLITSAEVLTTGPKGTDGTQYYLSVEIVASGIQAEGITNANSAAEAWANAKTENK